MVVKRLLVSRKHFLGNPGGDLAGTVRRKFLMCTAEGRHTGYTARTDLIRPTACEMTLNGDLEQVLQ